MRLEVAKKQQQRPCSPVPRPITAQWVAIVVLCYAMPPAPKQHKPLSIGKQHQARTVATVRHKPVRRGARQRGYDKRWERFRASFLANNPLCEFCLAKGVSRMARVVDHDIPHRGDPALFWDNTFTALCDRCHSHDKQRLEARFDGEALRDRVAVMKLPKAGGGSNF